MTHVNERLVTAPLIRASEAGPNAIPPIGNPNFAPLLRLLRDFIKNEVPGF